MGLDRTGFGGAAGLDQMGGVAGRGGAEASSFMIDVFNQGSMIKDRVKDQGSDQGSRMKAGGWTWRPARQDEVKKIKSEIL